MLVGSELDLSRKSINSDAEISKLGYANKPISKKSMGGLLE